MFHSTVSAEKSYHYIHQAVTSLSWQKSKPVIVNENSSTAETVLLGGAIEDSVLMPDPLPSASTGSSISTAVSGSRNSGRSVSSTDSFSFLASSSSSISTTPSLSAGEETPIRSNLWTGGPLTRLHATRSYNIKDDMEMFSPVVDVQPITPSLDKLWDDHDGVKKDHDKKPSLLFPSSRRFPLSEDGGSDIHPILDWKSTSVSKQV